MIAVYQVNRPTVIEPSTIALEAGTAVIGKLAPNDGVDIGDVTLNAGIAAIGKLSPNNGVDIGDVGIERVIPANLTATIANGASLSNEIDFGGSSMQMMLMPTAWTVAVITFQVAEATGGTLRNAYDEFGNEVSVTIAASRAVPVPLELAGVRFVKIRSGTGGSAVNQGAECIITVILKG